MAWLWYALTGYTFLAIVFILDKHILTQDKQSPVVYTFFSSVFLLLISLFWLYVPFVANISFWGMAFVSGITFVAGLYTMFVAVAKTAASRIDPFIGAVITVATFVIAHIFLYEELNRSQMYGIGLLVVASVILSFEKKKVQMRTWYWYGVGICAGILFAVSNVSAKYLYDGYSLIDGLIATRFAAGTCALLLLFAPVVQKSLKHVQKQNNKKQKKAPIALIAVDKILGLIGIFLLQLATASGSVTKVNALSGLQYGIMFVIIVFMSQKKNPYIYEVMSRTHLLAQTIALVFIGVGLYLIV